MRRIFGLIVALLVFVACVFLGGCQGQIQKIRFLTPDGGTLLPVAKMFHDKSAIADLEMEGEIVNAVAIESRMFAGTCEAAIAPVNLGAKVFQDNGTYVLAGIVSWGNNYILSMDGDTPETLDDLRGEVLYAWGQEAVPGKTLKTVLERHEVPYEVVSSQEDADPSGNKISLLFMADPPSISQAINKPGSSVRYAMLPEPSVTNLDGATLGNGKTPKIVFDVQVLYSPENAEADYPNKTSYPQAGLMIKKTLIEQHPQAVLALLETVQASVDYCLQNPAQTAQIAKEELQSVALPSTGVLEKYIQGRGQSVMHYESVSKAGIKEAVNEYLTVIMGAAPSDAFYYIPSHDLS